MAKKAPTATDKPEADKNENAPTSRKSRRKRSPNSKISAIDGPQPSNSGCVVVGIGASAGGLDAYKRLLRHLPSNPGVAFVLVQHLDPTHESLMAELLSKYTDMEVLKIHHAMPVQPNRVYMIPQNKFVRLKDNALLLDQPVTHRGVRLPIDHFFRSLASERRERAICIVLSGTGSDGTDGLQEVKAAGGMTLAEKPESAEYDGMPRAAISSGAVDFVLPIDEMAEVILPYARHPYVQAPRSHTLVDSAPDHFRAILNLLSAHTSLDFARYKTGTLARRIERRMGIRRLRDPAEYLALLRGDNDELHALFKDMLIGVTRFFRDATAWEALRRELEQRIAPKRNDEAFRVWVPGCSSGEEAYTIAILLQEIQTRQNKRLDIQVFGTDIDADAIEHARRGLYPESVIGDLPESWVDAYFQHEGDKLRITKTLREYCIFAVQNLLSDPPFSNLDLISCRNLLIYLEPSIQQRVFELMHFALRSEGLLLLGSSESPAKTKRLFDTVSQNAHLYQKLGVSRPGSGGFPLDGGRSRLDQSSEQSSESGPAAPSSVAELSRNALLDVYAPASVVVNGRGQIQYLQGPVRNYLDFPSGEPAMDLFRMVLEGLRAKTRTALHQAQNEGKEVSLLAPRVRRNGDVFSVWVRIHPLPQPRGTGALYLVSFVDEQPLPPSQDASHATPEPSPETGNATERQLILELQATREDLQSTIEELESANEELKASNEEVMSMNEELQSTNEELETSREELQSVNEELSTVNNQLHDKIEQLESTTDDLTNLLASTDMATLFLDSDLRIRRFTPATTRLMSLLDTDIGRPLSDLAPRVDDPELEQDAREVLRKLAPVQREVRNGSRQHYMRNITPFRTAADKIEGVVVTYSDVTMLKNASQKLELRERQQAAIARLGRAALAGEPSEALFKTVVREIRDTLDVDLVKLLRLQPDQRKFLLIAGIGWGRSLIGRATVPADIQSQAGYTLQSPAPVICADLRKEKRFSSAGLLADHDVISGLSVIVGPEQSPWGVLGAHSRHPMEFSADDTNFLMAAANVLWEAVRREAIEAELRANERRTAAFLNNSAVFAWMKDRDGRYIYLSDNYRKRFDFIPEDWYGKTDAELWSAEAAETFRANDQRVMESGETVEGVESATAKNGREGHFLVSKFRFEDAVGNRFVGGLGVDVTDTVGAERAQRASERRLRQLIESASIGIAFARVDGAVISANDKALEMFEADSAGFERRGWNWQDSGPPCEPEFGQTVCDLAQGRIQGPYVLERKDIHNETAWWLVSAQMLQDEEHYVAFLVDITAQKQAELALMESEERLRLAARLARFGTYYVDLEKQTVQWSKEFKDILGIPIGSDAAVGIAEVPEFVHQEDRARVAEKLKQCLDPAGDGEFRDEHRIVRPDGSIRWLLMQGRTLFKGKGDKRRAVRTAGVALDITERHRFEEKLKQSRATAEAANAAKSQFLANMSHEIRTPLTAILGFADVLHRRAQDPDDRVCIDTIRANGDHLCQILDDVLDLARIEAGKMEIRSDWCDPVELATGIIKLLEPRASQKGLELELEFVTAMPHAVQSDAKMLRQILLNLVGNAINFTSEGRVVLRAQCSAERQRLHLEVRDTGVGISPASLEKLFEPFEQADASRARRVGGSGLGLSITRRLIDVLDGELSVESEPGQGSTFSVTLPTGPLKDARWRTPEALTEEPMAGIRRSEPLPRIDGRVLSIDDRPEIRVLLKEFIEAAGGTCITAASADKGFAALENFRALGQPIDVILMDVQMPGIDGLKATRSLRQQGFTGTIIALTASAMKEDREACLNAGCNDVITKPVNREQLTRMLHRLLQPSPPPEDRDSNPPVVLLVDDNEDVRVAQSMLLEQMGYRVETAPGGREALHLVKRIAPAVILIDMGLDDMTGSELVERLRKEKTLSDSRMICLSGRQEEEVQWRAAGFDAYLQKPAALTDLEAAIEADE